MATRRWWWLLAAAAAVGLAVRVAYVLGWHNPSELFFDARYYTDGANLLADGEGLPHPIKWAFLTLNDLPGYLPGADHPPLTIFFLAIPSLLGFRSPLAHQLWMCVAGTATIVVIGLAGRRIAGPAVGLVAAAVAAVGPQFWMHDALLMSETLAQLGVAVVILTAYRWADRKRLVDAMWLGVAIAVATYARAELILLAPLIFVPALLRDGGALRERLAPIGVATLAVVALLLPWHLYNLTRFERPFFMTPTSGLLLAYANCDGTYNGAELGGWDIRCGFGDGKGLELDDSVADARARAVGLEYVADHAGRLPVVIPARLGRTFGLFAVGSELSLAARSEGKHRGPSLAGLVLSYALAVLGAIGAVRMWRSRRWLAPLLAPIATVALVSVLGYGALRFRAPADPSFALLAAVGLMAVVERARRARPHPSESTADR